MSKGYDGPYGYDEDEDYGRPRSSGARRVIREEPDRAPARQEDMKPPQLRAGNHQRELVITRLNEALEYGFLTKEEHTERLAAAQTCFSRFELLHLIADLPEQPEVEVLSSGVRASAAYRDHCIAWITKMAGTGRLDTDEQTNRIHHIQRAKTVRDIGLVMRDLPAMPAFEDPDLEVVEDEEPSIWARIPHTWAAFKEMLKSLRWSKIHPVFRVIFYLTGIFTGLGMASVNWWVPLMPRFLHVTWTVAGLFLIVASIIMWAMDSEVGR